MKNMPEEKKYHQYAAFLRGINVGGNTVIKMEALRKEFESLDFRNVKTVLASGNVFFETPVEKTSLGLSQEISQKLKVTLGREILVIVRPIDELRAFEARQPFDGIEVTPGIRLFVTFIREHPVGRNNSASTLPPGIRIISASDGIVCSVLEEQPGIDTVMLMAALEKEYGREVTTRTWKTLEKLLKAG